jgi:hydrogenase maturation factor
VDLLRDPGMSVVPDARIACEVGGVHAMHDPTEGGLCTGLYELGRAAGLGVEVDEDAIIVLDLSFDLCARFGIDPLRTLASGCLLICVEPEHVEALLAAYHKAGIAAAAIGRMTEQDYVLTRKGLRYELIRDEKDTVTRIFQTELL